MKVNYRQGFSFLALAAALASPGTAAAQDAANQEQKKELEAAGAEQSDVEGGEIIVTGSVNAQRKFDVSYAVTSLTSEDIQKRAPLNFADLLGQVPGIHVESTGGEVQNVYRLRGIPNEGSFQAFQQDGMPIYHDNDGNWFKSDVLNRIDLMTRSIEFVRGGPAPIFASNATAIYNQLIVTGSERPEGAVQVTVGDTDLYRLDAYSAGPLGNDFFYAVGGFIRQNDGYRDAGFPSDRGGQIRANVVKRWDSGELKLSGTYLNDHNVFNLPIPIADPRNPDVSLDPYIDYFTGTLNTPVLRNNRMIYSDGAGGRTSDDRDLADGRHMRFFMAGLDYVGEFGDWTVTARGRHTDGRVDFDALYSTTNPADANTFAAGYLNAARAAFNTPTATVARLGYAIAGTNGQTIYDPSSASGLVIQGQYRAIYSDFYSTQGDLRVSRDWETGLGRHSVAVGLYGSLYGSKTHQRYQDHLFELVSQPRTLDLVAYSATGQVLGYVTHNGVLRYSTTVTGGESDVDMWAVYLNDTWQVTDKLRLDAGIRHERYVFDGFGLAQATYNLGDPTTLADDATRGFTGVSTPRTVKDDVTPWTVGANYDIAPWLGVYGRASEAFRVPGESIVYSGSTPVTVKARQYEVGLKIDQPYLKAYFTGFYTKFDPFNASFVAFNPVTGRNDQSLTFIGTAETKGVEADVEVRPTRWLTLAGTVTISDPTMSDLVNEFGASAAAVEGNQLVREPKVYGNFRPAVDFTVGEVDVETYVRYNYTGKRYVDLFNRTALPAFDTFGAGIIANYRDWSFQVVGDNIFNSKGLTEGNPRTDQLAGQGSADAIYGRTVFGRNFRFVLTKRW